MKVTGPAVMAIYRTFEHGGERIVKALKTHNLNMNGKLRKTLLINSLSVMAARKHRIAADANWRQNARNERNAEMT